MTNDEISVVLDYLDEQIKILAKNDQKLKDRINYLQEQINEMSGELERTHKTAINAEAMSYQNFNKGLFQ